MATPNWTDNELDGRWHFGIAMLDSPDMFRILIALVLLCTLAIAQEKAAEPPAASANPAPSSGGSSSSSPEMEVLKSVPPKYPLAAVEKGIFGQVLLRILVTETGEVESAEVVSGEEVLRQPALDAVKQWKFKPYVEDGKPIKVKTTIPINFHKAVRVEAERGKLTYLPAGVTAGMLVHRVDPVYPSLAIANRRQGAVVFHALISKDGRVENLTVVSGPKEFVPEASAAVKQWRYKPYLLMGEPVEVETTIEIHFALSPY